MSLRGELSRRNAVKVAVVYAIVGWLLIEVLSVLLPASQAPEWVVRLFSFCVIAGLPVALIIILGVRTHATGHSANRNSPIVRQHHQCNKPAPPTVVGDAAPSKGVSGREAGIVTP